MLRHHLAALLVLSTTLGACGGSSEMPAAFPLSWDGVESTPSLTERGRNAAAGKSFNFERIVDKRQDPSKVGTDQETRAAFRTSSNVSAYVSERVHSLLETSGLKLQETGDYIVQGELVEYTVSEGNEFTADVRLLMRVFKVGAPAFENTYLGKAKSFGSTHGADNVNEALSNAMLSAVSQFVHDDLLADFLEGKAATKPAAATK